MSERYPEVTLTPDEVAEILRREDRVLEIGANDNPTQKECWEQDDLKGEVFDIVTSAIDERLGKERG